MTSSHPSLTISFSIRAESPNTPPLARYLFGLISIKRSNLCVSADVHTTYELLKVAEEVGDYICILKTHADIIDDWSDETIKGLQEIANRKHFLLFEDRKLGDIGNTLQSQYTRGPLRIATWAHLTNAHLLPGPAIIPALHSAAQATLTSLNQSVDTIITTGSPHLNRDQETNPETSTIKSTSTTPREPPSSSSTTAQPPSPSPGATPSAPTPAPTSESLLLSSHIRNRDGTASATTTISQHSEPISPAPPPQQPTPTTTTKPSALTALGPPPNARGLLLLAQMSSQGNLLTPTYTAACLSAARSHPDFVLGFICQRSLNQLPGDNFLSMAPGVNLPPEGEEGEGGVKGDGKGQQWRGPKEVVHGEGVDIVIVGRGVLGAGDRGREAERYRRVAWGAYEGRVRGE